MENLYFHLRPDIRFLDDDYFTIMITALADHRSSQTVVIFGNTKLPKIRKTAYLSIQPSRKDHEWHYNATLSAAEGTIITSTRVCYTPLQLFRTLGMVLKKCAIIR